MAERRARGTRGGVGIWIDHTQAIFVWLVGNDVQVTTVPSEAVLRGRASPHASETKEQAEQRLARRRRQQRGKAPAGGKG